MHMCIYIYIHIIDIQYIHYMYIVLIALLIVNRESIFFIVRCLHSLCSSKYIKLHFVLYEQEQET